MSNPEHSEEAGAEPKHTADSKTSSAQLSPQEESPSRSGPPTFDKGDLITLTVSALSLIVALASLAFSIMTHLSTQEEHIAVQLSPHGGLDQARLVSFGSGPGTPGIMQQWWTLTISNTGDRTVSIVEHEVREMTEHGGSYYSHLYGGLADQAGSSVQLPLTLESGRSVRLNIAIGLRLDGRASSALAQEYGTDVDVSRHEVDKHLAEAGLDIYGNARVLTEHPGGGFMIEGPGPERHEQQLVLVLRSGKGHAFFGHSSLYGDSLR